MPWKTTFHQVFGRCAWFWVEGLPADDARAEVEPRGASCRPGLRAHIWERLENIPAGLKVPQSSVASWEMFGTAWTVVPLQWAAKTWLGEVTKNLLVILTELLTSFVDMGTSRTERISSESCIHLVSPEFKHDVQQRVVVVHVIINVSNSSERQKSQTSPALEPPLKPHLMKTTETMGPSPLQMCSSRLTRARDGSRQACTMCSELMKPCAGGPIRSEAAVVGTV